MSTETNTTACYCRHISTIKPVDYSDLPVVSTKNVTGRYRSLAITHYERKEARRSLGEMQSEHIYNYPIDIRIGLYKKTRIYGNLSIEVYDCDYSREHKNNVNMKVELICEKDNEWQWRIDEFIRTHGYAFMRQADIKDEDLWYFIAGKMFNEIYTTIVRSVTVTDAKIELNNAISFIRDTFDFKVAAYIELTHWNHDKNSEDKVWRANDEYHWNYRDQFMAYTNDNKALRED